MKGVGYAGEGNPFHLTGFFLGGEHKVKVRHTGRVRRDAAKRSVRADADGVPYGGLVVHSTRTGSPADEMGGADADLRISTDNDSASIRRLEVDIESIAPRGGWLRGCHSLYHPRRVLLDRQKALLWPADSDRMTSSKST